MKLKPKDYKNISDKEKYEIKFDYDYKKTKRNDGEKCSRNLKNDIFGIFRNIKWKNEGKINMIMPK